MVWHAVDPATGRISKPLWYLACGNPVNKPWTVQELRAYHRRHGKWGGDKPGGRGGRPGGSGPRPPGIPAGMIPVGHGGRPGGSGPRPPGIPDGMMQFPLIPCEADREPLGSVHSGSRHSGSRHSGSHHSSSRHSSSRHSSSHHSGSHHSGSHHSGSHHSGSDRGGGGGSHHSGSNHGGSHHDGSQSGGPAHGPPTVHARPIFYARYREVIPFRPSHPLSFPGDRPENVSDPREHRSSKSNISPPDRPLGSYHSYDHGPYGPVPPMSQGYPPPPPMSSVRPSDFGFGENGSPPFYLGKRPRISRNELPPDLSWMDDEELYDPLDREHKSFMENLAWTDEEEALEEAFIKALKQRPANPESDYEEYTDELMRCVNTPEDQWSASDRPRPGESVAHWTAHRHAREYLDDYPWARNGGFKKLILEPMNALVGNPILEPLNGRTMNGSGTPGGKIRVQSGGNPKGHYLEDRKRAFK
ncbi:hypothetical protein MMC28_008472 [Mycoblastus sanguinarius]|nr:hypothetical protein [Mycoblastus sanguinarius]